MTEAFETQRDQLHLAIARAAAFREQSSINYNRVFMLEEQLEDLEHQAAVQTRTHNRIISRCLNFTGFPVYDIKTCV